MVAQKGKVVTQSTLYRFCEAEGIILCMNGCGMLTIQEHGKDKEKHDGAVLNTT